MRSKEMLHHVSLEKPRKKEPLTSLCDCCRPAEGRKEGGRKEGRRQTFRSILKLYQWACKHVLFWTPFNIMRAHKVHGVYFKFVMTVSIYLCKHPLQTELHNKRTESHEFIYLLEPLEFFKCLFPSCSRMKCNSMLLLIVTYKIAKKVHRTFFSTTTSSSFVWL